MTQPRQNFTLSDGRNLEYLTNGIESDSAIILHAGTSQDITGWQTWLDYFATHGIFALSFGRSGYVGSTKKLGRITIDVAHDVAELSTALGVNRFVNIGLSGGGQHAIATGLDPRSAGVVTVGSLAPFDELGDHFFTGMQQADLDEYADALKGIDILVNRFRSWLDGDVSETIVGGDLSDRDKLASTKTTWNIALNSCAYTMQQGLDWVADDYSSYLKPWGFDPSNVKVPTVIWQAELDKNVPIQHGQWLAAHMPNSRLEIGEGESHMGLFVNYEEEIMQSAIALLTSS
jgi:pimeloyl-ACP methyl ester carboxylesterase